MLAYQVAVRLISGMFVQMVQHIHWVKLVGFHLGVDMYLRRDQIHCLIAIALTK